MTPGEEVGIMPPRGSLMRRPRLLSVATLLLAAVAPAFADVVHMKDGRRLEGETQWDGDTLVVKSKYGEIRVARADIARIETSSPPRAEPPAPPPAPDRTPPVVHATGGRFEVGAASVAIPAGWVVEKDELFGDQVLRSPRSSGKSRMEVSLRIQKESELARPDTPVATWLERVRSRLAGYGYKFFRSGTRRFGAIGAIFQEYENPPSRESSAVLRFATVDLFCEGKLYSLVASVDASVAGAYEAIVDELILSIEVQGKKDTAPLPLRKPPTADEWAPVAIAPRWRVAMPAGTRAATTPAQGDRPALQLHSGAVGTTMVEVMTFELAGPPASAEKIALELVAGARRAIEGRGGRIDPTSTVLDARKLRTLSGETYRFKFDANGKKNELHGWVVLDGRRVIALSCTSDVDASTTIDRFFASLEHD